MLGDTSHHDVRQAASPVGPHHDQVDVTGDRIADDFRSRYTNSRRVLARRAFSAWCGDGWLKPLTSRQRELPNWKIRLKILASLTRYVQEVQARSELDC
jgi:hypothetical protein